MTASVLQMREDIIEMQMFCDQSSANKMKYAELATQLQRTRAELERLIVAELIKGL